jgi:hypothetical protein
LPSDILGRLRPERAGRHLASLVRSIIWAASVPIGFRLRPSTSAGVRAARTPDRPENGRGAGRRRLKFLAMPRHPPRSVATAENRRRTNADQSA